MEEVGVLGGGVVTPDRHVGDVVHRDVELLGELRLGPVVIETGHCGEAGVGDVGRIVHRNERVGVGGVAHDQNLDVVGGIVVDRFALGGEDRAVGFEEVLALHTLRAGAGTDEHADVGTVERRVGVVAQGHAGEQREGAVVELHRNTLERAHRRRDLEQLQDDGLIWAEHRAAGDTEKEAVADLTGGTGHRDTNRSSHGLSP